MKVTLMRNTISKAASTLLVFSMLVFTPFVNCLAEAFVVNDYPATDPENWPIRDPEFDDVNFRVLWQTRNEDNVTLNTLKVSNIGSDGTFVPASVPTPLASGLAKIDLVNANGPEWIHSAFPDEGTSIIYTAKVDNIFQLKAIKEYPSGSGIWQEQELGMIPITYPRFNAIGTSSGNTGYAKIAYFAGSASPGYQTYWRNLYGSDINENLISDGRVQAHFSLDGAKMALALPDTNLDGSTDPWVLNLLSPPPERVRDYSSFFAAGFPYVFYDINNNRETMLYTLDMFADPVLVKRIIVVEQKFPSLGWRRIKTIEAQEPDEPYNEPYITSPEVFVVNDIPYVVFAALSDLNPALADHGSIWIAKLTDTSLPQKITLDTLAKRYEPEPLKLPNGKVIIYYNTSQSWLRIADTGLQEE